MILIQGGRGNEGVQRDRGEIIIQLVENWSETLYAVYRFCIYVGWGRHRCWFKTSNPGLPILPLGQVFAPDNLFFSKALDLWALAGTFSQRWTPTGGKEAAMCRLQLVRWGVVPSKFYLHLFVCACIMVKNLSSFSDLDQEIVYCSGHGNCDTAELPSKVPSDQARYRHIRPVTDISDQVHWTAFAYNGWNAVQKHSLTLCQGIEPKAYLLLARAY